MSSSMKFRARSRSAVSIGSNQLSKSSPSTEQAAAFMLSFVMAWSPVRRSNAGIRWVETPGDYATLNSNHSRDATPAFPGEDSPANTTYGPSNPFDATPAQVRAAVDDTNLSVTGTGIKIGVMSNSFNSENLPAADLGYGTVLPQSTMVKDLQDDTSTGGEDEGRAMMQIVHDIAPGASLDFYTADIGYGTSQWDQDFANGIQALWNDGCKIICEDISVVDAPWFQSGVIAQEIQAFEQAGGIFIACAGNQASAGYQSAWSSTSIVVNGTTYSDALNFGTAQNPTPFQNVTVPPNTPTDPASFMVQWAQPWGDATTDLELIVSQNGVIKYTATIANNASGETNDPMIDPGAGIGSDGDAFVSSSTQTYQVSIINLSGTNPSLVKYIAYGDGTPITIAGANAGTLSGDNASPYEITVGAVSAGNTPAFGNAITSEPFSSSDLGTQWLFNSNGTALSSPLQFSPIALSGVDDINTSDVVNGTNYNPDFSDFFGTSAATPSVAGVVALMLQTNPNLTEPQVDQILQASAVSMGTTSAITAVAGAGLVQANVAVADAADTGVLWVDDSSGVIGEVNSATGAVTVVGNSGQILTDMAFNARGQLFGVTYTALYSINPATGAASLIGDLNAGSGDINGLAFSSTGVLYGVSGATDQLYSIDTQTGQATALSGTLPASSAGAIAFDDGNPYLSDSNGDLDELTITGSAVSATVVGSIGFSNVLGLSTGPFGVLYGVSGTELIAINPVTGAGTLVLNYSG